MGDQNMKDNEYKGIYKDKPDGSKTNNKIQPELLVISYISIKDGQKFAKITTVASWQVSVEYAPAYTCN